MHAPIDVCAEKYVFNNQCAPNNEVLHKYIYPCIISSYVANVSVSVKDAFC